MVAKIQLLKNKLGEIKFRERLALQFLGKGCPYPGEPNSKEYFKRIKDEIKAYKEIFRELKEKKIALSPFFEIGAGVGQGSMLLCNEFGEKGYASDISAETLALSKLFAKKLKFKKMPTLLACDAYHLPFPNNSLSFVFLFQTLHHFPDPKPVMEEVKRVLRPGGYFYFGEEPVAQIFNLNLWRRDMHLTWWEKILKATTLLHFISRIGKSEIDHGILEETFDLNTWNRALEIFDQVEVVYEVFPFGPKFTKGNFFQNLLLEILGGGISGLCRKQLKTKYLSSSNNLLTLLTCPDCKSHPKLVSLTCSICRRKFKKRNEILVLLPRSLARTI